MIESNTTKTTSKHKLSEVTVGIERVFSYELQQLRLNGFSDRYSGDLIDNIDQQSHHMVVRSGNTALSTVRITSAQTSILQHWFSGKFPIVDTIKTAELTRGAVNDDYQGMGFYKLIMLEAILHYPQLGFETSICAARLDLPQLSFLYELGFENLGSPLLIESKIKTVMLQPLKLVIDKCIKNVEKLYFSQLENMKRKGIKVSSLTLQRKTG